MDANERLCIGGLVAGGELRLSAADLAALPASAQVADVGQLVPGKQGRGVRLAALLERARPDPNARFVDLASSETAFAVSLSLAELGERAVVMYGLDPQKGGPFRMLVPGHPDECVHVKRLVRIDFSRARGRDTRPVDDAEHAKLHAACKKH
jgi:DMSO/TMAO reductase YedYZ molybdopterin-dependent catalytic subunit